MQIKSLVIGLGSMGKRRIRCLKALQSGPIAGFDMREDRRSEVEEKYGVGTYADFEQALQDFQPDALIICTPPNKHISLIREGVERGKHVFCEIGTILDGLPELISLIERSDKIAAASCTPIFQPSVKKMREIIAAGGIGKIHVYTHHCGQYLPDWHPFEDYRGFYVSQPETSACREIVPWELQWLTHVVGSPPTLVTGMQDKLTDLDCDIPDAYQLLIRHDNKVLGHILMDIIARAPIRHTRILGSDGILEWNVSAKLLRHFDAATKSWSEHPEPPPVVESGYSEMSTEGPYIEEMKAFVTACLGGTPFPNRFVNELLALKALYTSEKAYASRTILPIEAP